MMAIPKRAADATVRIVLYKAFLYSSSSVRVASCFVVVVSTAVAVAVDMAVDAAVDAAADVDVDAEDMGEGSFSLTCNVPFAIVTSMLVFSLDAGADPDSGCSTFGELPPRILKR